MYLEAPEKGHLQVVIAILFFTLHSVFHCKKLEEKDYESFN